MTTLTQQAELIRFPSTNQFRNVVQAVRHDATFVGLDPDGGQPLYASGVSLPTLLFRGTVKLHGTNAAVVYSPSGIHFQSRERVLGPGDADNMGFYAHMSKHLEVLQAIKHQLLAYMDIDDHDNATIAIYGEWCGGSIQKTVALNQLPKMFVAFLININGLWFEADSLASRPDASFYNVLDFPNYTQAIDFNYPELAQNELARITEEVERCCPVAHHFGVDGIGEGVVWRCLSRLKPEYWFKVKGEKHSASKVKTLAAVEVEAVKAVMDFVAATVTEARLNQAHHHLKYELQKPVDQTSTGDFIRWVVTDIHKEEADTLAASGLEAKQVNPKISAAAKAWYFQRLAGLA